MTDTWRHRPDDWCQWKDEDLAWQGVFDADPEWSIAHNVHVFIFKDVETLRRASKDPKAHAYSIAYNEPDANGIGAVIMFAPQVPLAAIAHEVTHVALFWARRTATPNQRASRWLVEHPESVAELIGNLSAVLWHSLPKDLLDH